MKEKHSNYNSNKKDKKNLGINLRNMFLQDLHEKNFKTSLEGHIRPKEMERYTMFLDRKIYYEDVGFL